MTEMKENITIKRNTRLRIPTLRGNKTTIKDFGCKFTVYRQTASRKVVSVSLWKASMGYVPALSNALLWWNKNIKKLFPGFNIRVYMDKSVVKTSLKLRKTGDVDWIPILERLHKNPNVEIWLHDCGWGKLGVGKGKSYSQTFSSIVRFHPLFDRSVDVSVIRNLELLSSKEDSKLIKSWLHEGDRFHVYILPWLYGCYPTHIPNEMYINQCKKSGLLNKRMLLAGWFAAKGTLSSGLSHTQQSHFRNLINIVDRVGYNYGYGVDEVILTELFLNPVHSREQPLMNVHNTNITYLFTPSTLLRLAVGFQDDDFIDWLPSMTHRWERTCSDKKIGGAIRTTLQMHPTQSLKYLQSVFDTLGSYYSACLPMERDIMKYFANKKKEFIREKPAIFMRTFKKINGLIKGAFFSNAQIPNLLDMTFLDKHLGTLHYEEDLMAVTAIMSISSLEFLTFPGFAFKTKRFETLYRNPVKRKFLVQTLREDVMNR
jgi:hypothetical protein